MNKIAILCACALVCSFAWASEKESNEITVYKSPYCGCCKKWISYLKKNGFSVNEKRVNNVAIYKKKYEVSPQLSSCHTAVVEGYIIEGHVPIDDINKLLREKPDIRGLTVPGMPVGSPGMEQGNKKDTFSVLAIKKDGSTFTYSTYNEK